MVSPLPLSVVTLPGESMTSLLFRIAEVNNITGIGHLVRLSGCHVVGPMVYSEIVELARLCRLDKEQLRDVCPAEITIRRGAPTFGYVVYGHFIEEQHLIVRRFERVCPHCMREHGYLLAAHQMALMTACPLHKVRLIDCCPGCRKPISVARPSLTFCRCGFDLSEAIEAEACGDEWQLSSLLYRWWIEPRSAASGWSRTMSDKIRSAEAAMEKERGASPKWKSLGLDEIRSRIAR